MIPLYLPYYEQPHWDIGPLTIHAFGVLVAIALVVGTWVCRWHGSTKGQNATVVVDAATWTCISGFIVGHLVSVIFYFPERILEDPLQLVYVWNGLSSFGGFFGAALGLFIFLKKRGLPLLEYYETISVGLGPGWILGRLGCTVAHDHPGHQTDFFLAFDHPNRGPIHDLGFYEFLFAIFVTILVFIIRRLKWPVGSIPAAMCIVYSPVRFMLDFLRVSDVTYSPVTYVLGLSGDELLDPAPWWYMDFTPGQWFAVALFALGVAVMVVAWRGRGRTDASKADEVQPTSAGESEISKSAKADGDGVADSEEEASDSEEEASDSDEEADDSASTDDEHESKEDAPQKDSEDEKPRKHRKR